MNEKPRFEHDDCSGCHFLGLFDRYDLYYCTNEPTVICRYSSEGGDYGSGLTFAVTSDRICYTEALIRALRKGLWREQIIKYFDRERSFPERVERFYELLKIADTSNENLPLLLDSLKTQKARTYLEYLLTVVSD